MSNKKSKSIQSIQDIIKASPLEVADWVSAMFIDKIPISVETIEELDAASKLMAKCTNQYSSLCGMMGFIKSYIRQAKNSGNKELAEELIDKRDCLQWAMESVKLRISTLSRMITIKQEINRELNMSSKN